MTHVTLMSSARAAMGGSASAALPLPRALATAHVGAHDQSASAEEPCVPGPHGCRAVRAQRARHRLPKSFLAGIDRGSRLTPADSTQMEIQHGFL